MAVIHLRHDDIGRVVVAQHHKTEVHRPIALSRPKKDGKFHEAPKLKGLPGTNPGVIGGRTRLFAAYEYSNDRPDFVLETEIP